MGATISDGDDVDLKKTTGMFSTEPRSDNTWLNTASIMILATVAVAGALYFTGPVMVPFVLAIFISYLVSPLVDFLRVRIRLPKWVTECVRRNL